MCAVHFQTLYAFVLVRKKRLTNCYLRGVIAPQINARTNHNVIQTVLSITPRNFMLVIVQDAMVAYNFNAVSLCCIVIYDN